MKSQKKLIKKGDWDCLIVLDSCRFDYFEKTYGDFLNGELEKVLSGGWHTSVWVKNVWGDKKHDNVVYISASPYINSQGIELIKGFDGRYHLHEIVDVWDYGWSEELGTVLPSEMVKATHQSRLKYPDKKLVSHFLQPHYPFLNLEPVGGKWWGLRERGKGRDDRRLRAFAGKIIEAILGKKTTYKIGRLLNVTPPSVIEITAKRYGVDILRKAYEENLRIALREVAKLVKHLPGKCVITADHGELLGEDGFYAHPLYEEDNPYLIEVPWFEIPKNSEKNLKRINTQD